jgi:hypothetical protein
MKIKDRLFLTVLFITCSFFTSCDNDIDNEEETVIIDQPDIYVELSDSAGNNLLKNNQFTFKVISNNKQCSDFGFVEQNGIKYLKFKPSLSNTNVMRGDTLMTQSIISSRDNIICELHSLLKVDSVIIYPAKIKKIFISNCSNKVANHEAKLPIQLLVRNDKSYLVENDSKFVVEFVFPSLHNEGELYYQYDVVINAFGYSNPLPEQRMLAVNDNIDGTKQVVLAIDFNTHDYYDMQGKLQNPRNIIYTIQSESLFGNEDKHILKISDSGICGNNKILNCRLDGIELNVDRVVKHSTFGGEYLLIYVK